MENPDTYYHRTRAGENRGYPALESNSQTDVCIIGGGLAGVTTALELARLGRKVCLLEAREIAWGASGRNGGFVCPGFSADQAHIQRLAGQHSADELFRLSLEGMQLILDNIEQLEIPDLGLRHGVLRTARYNDADGLKHQRDLLDDTFSYPVEFISRDALQAQLKSRRYFQALRDSRAFSFHPLNYSCALVSEFVRLGGHVYEATPAIDVNHDGPDYKIKTPDGQITATTVVYATGGYTGNLQPRLQRSYIPVATYVLLSEANPTLLNTAIQTQDAVGDSRRAGDYYRLVDNGERLLWGGRITTRTTEPYRLAQLLRKTMLTTYPQLAPLKIDLAWSGLMAYARHLMPQIGTIGDNAWYCTGFGGHGMNTTAIGGRIIAEAITGSSDRYKLFAPFDLAWNGAAFGTAAVQLTYWYYQLLDAIREKVG